MVRPLSFVEHEAKELTEGGVLPFYTNVLIFSNY